MKKEIIDGNTAVAKASYKLSEISFIYPITPSSTMAEMCEEMSAKQEKNIFGNVVDITQMQSEGGAIGAVHGASLSGLASSTFTSSQGLLLMIPNMYKIAGEMLPVTIHVASRSIASHALNIFCDHSDVMSARQTGFAMLCSSTVQEAYDFALASHIASIKSSVPFLHFFDGFRTSHEISNVLTFDDTELKIFYPFESLQKYKANSLSPNSPFQIGTNEGPDVFFQGRERSNNIYKELPSVLLNTFKQIEKISGRKYQPFEYYGNKNAKYIIVIMGSGYGAVKSYIDSANDKEIGVLKVNLYRPFASELFLQQLPKLARKIAVLDRTKEQGSVGEPLYLDVYTCAKEHNPKLQIFGGRYGLGGKEFNPSMVKAVFDNLKQENTKNHFTVGIEDDISSSSLSYQDIQLPETKYTSILWGFGSDGTVSASKNIAKIVGSNENLYTQAYFMYDSKKSGGLTRSFLRFDNNPIEKPYLIQQADMVVCNNTSFLFKYDVCKSLKPNGTLLLNCKYKTQQEIAEYLPKYLLKDLCEKNAKIFAIDASSIAYSNGIDNKISAIMQTAFFKVSNIMDFETAKNKTIEMLLTSLSKKGKDVISSNINSITQTIDNICEIQIDKSWQNFQLEQIDNNDFINSVLNLNGDNLKVSAVNQFGKTKTATSNLEKRNISQKIPKWINENCVQCGKCSMVCPHSVIRSKILTDQDLTSAPCTLKYNKCNFDKNNNFVLEISPLDCTGCGLCQSVCPAKQKAIVLQNKEDILDAQLLNYDFTKQLESLVPNLPLTTAKSQFMQPYFEFSGACAGCGETPYIRLLTQLFGSRLQIANATGCSSIYGASSPTCPYTTNKCGQGPAWANSLFEDNAEFGLGITKSTNLKRTHLKNYVTKNIDVFKPEFAQIINTWLENFNKPEICNQIYFELLKNKATLCDKTSQFVFDNIDNITKKSTWIVGGDGWAYDIGFGGLDHIISSGENINILVLDTELYSNTGGQMSKSSQLGSVQKFSSKGKTTNKKRLSLMAMTYQNVYVAQVCLGADPNQTIKAFVEAENYNGVSIIIAYCPCINHGIDMSKNIERQQSAIKSGYWHLFRYNPELKLQQKPALLLDSPKPTHQITHHMLGERRFANLAEANNSEVFEKTKQSQDDFYDLLEKMSKY